MSARFPLLALALALAACASTTSPDNQVSLPQPQEITLQYGQVMELEGSTLRLGFADVLGDSRCPEGAVCIWEGNAEISVTAASGKVAADTLTLNTALDPQFADWRGVRITLLEVTPVPQVGQPIPLESYSIRLRAEPVPR